MVGSRGATIIRLLNQLKKKKNTDQDTMKHNRQTNKANKTHTKTATTEKKLKQVLSNSAR